VGRPVHYVASAWRTYQKLTIDRRDWTLRVKILSRAPNLGCTAGAKEKGRLGWSGALLSTRALA